ncbi:MAG: tetratricopeptide repeat protein [Ahniella sp.]|nr:tetratricopeptide repeat protein [Ahniella sp.]
MSHPARLLFLLCLALPSLVACEPLQFGQRIPDSEIIAVDKLSKTDPGAAAIRLENLLAEKPRDSLGWTILGHIRADMDEHEAAELAYRKALQINPKQIEAMTGQGILARKQGNYQRAMDHYRKAVEVDPDYAQAYSSMTTIALKLEQDDDAVRYARKGYELDPSDPVIVANFAIALHYVGDHKERDRMAAQAKKMGYGRMDALEALFAGEWTIRD